MVVVINRFHYIFNHVLQPLVQEISHNTSELPVGIMKVCGYFKLCTLVQPQPEGFPSLTWMSLVAPQKKGPGKKYEIVLKETSIFWIKMLLLSTFTYFIIASVPSVCPFSIHQQIYLIPNRARGGVTKYFKRNTPRIIFHCVFYSNSTQTNMKNSNLWSQHSEEKLREKRAAVWRTEWIMTVWKSRTSSWCSNKSLPARKN